MEEKDNKEKRKNSYAIIAALAFVVAILAGFGLYKNFSSPKKGAFKLNVVIFEDADKGISSITDVQLANVYYIGDLMIEEVPKLSGEEYCFIKGTQFSGYFLNLNELNFDNKLSLKEKKAGAVGLADTIPNYFERTNMSDTILDEIHYKRFAIDAENEYSVFYVRENLKLPYSLNKRADKDYKGSIARIDTYQREEDRFISVRLVPNDTIPLKFYNKLKN